MIDNVIIKGSQWIEDDIKLLFGDEKVHFTDSTSMPSLLKEIGVFKSTSEAMRAGRNGDIPKGFTDNFKASKKRRIWIWNPSE